MDWHLLLAPARLGRATPHTAAEGLRTAFFKDWDRIVFCSAFRRLQDKTQVQPLAKTDYVRTRLTHTLEVASVGRSLGMMAGQAILRSHPGLVDVVQPMDIGAIVAAACLMHDIGNPPFGHAGEAAIQGYFADRGQHWLDPLDDAERADLLRFDGNAQGFRTLVRLQHPDQPGGLQLTLPTLGAFCKYPRASLVPASAATGASGRKPGFMVSEQAWFEQLAEGLGLPRKGVPRGEGQGQGAGATAPGGTASATSAPAAWHRHPLAFLVEAADDICYGVVDLEDGVKSGHIGLDELVALHAPLAGAEAVARSARLHDRQHRAEYLRAVTIGVLVDATAAAFDRWHDGLLDARVDEPLLDHIDGAAAFARFQALARERLYAERSKAELQVAGYEIINGLLDTFCTAVESLHRGGLRQRAKSELVLRLLPQGERVVALPSPYQRLLAVTDFVAGMTDSYAVEMHRRLHGVALGA
jgi:dGTPase